MPDGTRNRRFSENAAKRQWYAKHRASGSRAASASPTQSPPAKSVQSRLVDCPLNPVQAL